MEQQPVTLPISKAIMKAKLKNIKKSVNNNMIKFKPDADTKNRLMEFFKVQSETMVMKYGDKITEDQFYQKVNKLKARCFKQIFEEVVTLRADMEAYKIYVEELRARVYELEQRPSVSQKQKLMLDQDSDEEDANELKEARAQIQKLKQELDASKSETEAFKAYTAEYQAEVGILNKTIHEQEVKLADYDEQVEEMRDQLDDARQQSIAKQPSSIEQLMCEIYFENMSYTPNTCIVCMCPNVPCYNPCLDHLVTLPENRPIGNTEARDATNILNWYKIQSSKAKCCVPVCMLCTRNRFGESFRQMEEEEIPFASAFKCVHNTQDSQLMKAIHVLAVLRNEEQKMRTPGGEEERLI